MTDLLKVINFLKLERKQIVFESEEDKGAVEYYGHVNDVIEQLEAGSMTIQQASDSLGIYF